MQLHGSHLLGLVREKGGMPSPGRRRRGGGAHTHPPLSVHRLPAHLLLAATVSGVRATLRRGVLPPVASGVVPGPLRHRRAGLVSAGTGRTAGALPAPGAQVRRTRGAAWRRAARDATAPGRLRGEEKALEPGPPVGPRLGVQARQVPPRHPPARHGPCASPGAPVWPGGLLNLRDSDPFPAVRSHLRELPGTNTARPLTGSPTRRILRGRPGPAAVGGARDAGVRSGGPALRPEPGVDGG